MRRRLVWLLLWMSPALVVVGCSNKPSSSGSGGSPAPSLDSPDAKERADAACEAGKKYGAKP